MLVVACHWEIKYHPHCGNVPHGSRCQFVRHRECTRKRCGRHAVSWPKFTWVTMMIRIGAGICSAFSAVLCSAARVGKQLIQSISSNMTRRIPKSVHIPLGIIAKPRVDLIQLKPGGKVPYLPKRPCDVFEYDDPLSPRVTTEVYWPCY